jgi:tetratricopeptide (TPR) repeat protein
MGLSCVQRTRPVAGPEFATALRRPSEDKQARGHEGGRAKKSAASRAERPGFAAAAHTKATPGQARERPPGSPKPAVASARDSKPQKAEPEVLRLAKRFVAEYPNDEVAWFKLGKAHYYFGYADWFRVITECDDDYYSLRCLRQLRNATDTHNLAAINALQQAVRINPDYIEAHRVLGRSYKARAEWLERLSTLCAESIAVQRGSRSSYRLSEGNAQSRDRPEVHEGKDDGANALLDLAKQSSIEVERLHARYLEHMGPAIDYQQRSESPWGVPPLTASERQALAVAAVAEWETAIRFKPCSTVRNFLSEAYLKVGRHDDAIELHRRELRFRPDSAFAHYDLGTVYLRKGDKESAMAEYRILTKLDEERAGKLLEAINKKR